MNFVAKLSRVQRSYTMWFNAVVGSLYIVVPALAEAFPALQGYVPDKLYHYAMALLVFGNIVLRFKTNKPLEER